MIILKLENDTEQELDLTLDEWKKLTHKQKQNIMVDFLLENHTVYAYDEDNYLECT